MRSLTPIVALALAACSSAPAPSPSATAPATIAAAPATPPTAITPRAQPIDDGALREAEASRDPFRAYEGRVAPPPLEDTRARKARRASVEELEVIGVITRTREPRALLRDGRGKGFIVAPGDLVGRPEVVPTGRASWRVDRIREREVVLVREAPDTLGPAPMKVLALAPSTTLSADD